MNKINWRQKFGSRKFWALLAGLAISVGVVIGAGDAEMAKIAGLITALGAVVSYMFSEASIDNARTFAEAEKEIARIKSEDYSDGY
ncbi:MAG: hypothetical protein Q4A52_06680 [Bacillota bacterium]|nr:hypothetical protein [Bacillota bacterium]